MIKAIKIKKNVLSEFLVTLLSIFIVVCLYIYLNRRNECINKSKKLEPFVLSLNRFNLVFYLEDGYLKPSSF